MTASIQTNRHESLPPFLLILGTGEGGSENQHGGDEPTDTLDTTPYYLPGLSATFLPKSWQKPIHFAYHVWVQKDESTFGMWRAFRLSGSACHSALSGIRVNLMACLNQTQRHKHDTMSRDLLAHCLAKSWETMQVICFTASDAPHEAMKQGKGE